MSNSAAPLRALDKYGWPVETFRGRPIISAIRLLIHTRRIARWTPPAFTPDPNVTTPYVVRGAST